MALFYLYLYWRNKSTFLIDFSGGVVLGWTKKRFFTGCTMVKSQLIQWVICFF